MHLRLFPKGDKADPRRMRIGTTPRSGRRARIARGLVLTLLIMLIPVGVLAGISFVRHREEAQLLWFGATWLVAGVAALLLRRLKRVRTVEGQLEQTREQLEHQVLHDPLTGLSNRTLFIEEMERAIEHSSRQGASMSVLYLDLDGFKSVNDTLGHDAGDEMLIQVASHLRRALRKVDSLARLGGDEFGVLLNESIPAATRTAERLVKIFEGPWATAGGRVPVTVSIGVASRDHGEELDELLNQADAAMYAAKDAGKNRWRVWKPEMNSVTAVSDSMYMELDRALQQGEFAVRYQPIVTLGSGRIAGVEALIRWNHPTRGVLRPADFLQDAEESGHIVAVDRWVLRQACREVRRCQRAVPGAAELSVHVNLSAAQLQYPGLTEDVTEALRSSGLAPEHLVLEITETSLVRDAETAAIELRKLKRLGVDLALDDFGTGFSSLSHLLNFPIDIIKIDRVFIAALGVEGHRPALALALVNLGRTLGLCVVAEGIEKRNQLELLLAIECEQGQGNYFEEPLEASLLEPLLRRHAGSIAPELSFVPGPIEALA